jgi:hypothetical protein
MVIDMNIDQFIQTLMLDSWFSNVFSNKKEIGNDKKVVLSDNLKKSVKIWNNNFDDRCDQWETLRVKLIKNDDWVENFFLVKKKIYDILIKNENFYNFLNIISKEYSIDKDQFMSELPAIGAWGEYLLNLNHGYYTDQIIYYQNGFWVCGQHKNQFVIF